MTVHRTAGALLAAQARQVNDLLLELCPDNVLKFAKVFKVDPDDLKQAIEEERTRRQIEALQERFLP
jgi:hypothetical protein